MGFQLFCYFSYSYVLDILALQVTTQISNGCHLGLFKDTIQNVHLKFPATTKACAETVCIDY